MCESEKNITLLLFVRWPEPGRVKTRLAAALGGESACKIYTRLAERAFAEGMKVSGAKLIVCGTGATPETFARWLVGASAYWDQPEGALGERLAALFARAFDAGSAGVLAIGSDAPTLDAAAITTAVEALVSHDVCILPAVDGGYVLIGLRRMTEQLFFDMPWSTERLLQATSARCRSEGLSLWTGPAFPDVDTLEDWQRYSLVFDHKPIGVTL
ncbi:MAG: TIGR04282 family arsenosugar biosynthesis glycosyltransferase [Candidatus Sumerlaeia bacterium]